MWRKIGADRENAGGYFRNLLSTHRCAERGDKNTCTDYPQPDAMRMAQHTDPCRIGFLRFLGSCAADEAVADMPLFGVDQSDTGSIVPVSSTSLYRSPVSGQTAIPLSSNDKR